MGRATGAFKPPASTAHWSTTRKRTLGLISGITGIANQRRRLGTWAHTLHRSPTPAHEAEAFVRPSTIRRERSPALDRIERIIERMEHQQAAATSASSASSAQLHALIGQGEFLFSFPLKF
jgi:hypothetical protein